MPLHKLQPFGKIFPEISIECRIDDKTPALLQLEYRIEGPLDCVLWPTVPRPEPKELWKQSCFEFFEFSNTTPNYIEWNFSPLKELQQYRFESYRKLESSVPKFGFANILQFQRSKRDCRLSVEIPRIFPSSQFQSNVILFASEQICEFYAIQHGNKADFHKKLPLSES